MNDIHPIRPIVTRVKVSVKKIYGNPSTVETTILMEAKADIDEINFDCYPILKFADGFEFATIGMLRNFANTPNDQVTYIKKVNFDERSDIKVNLDVEGNGDWQEADFEYEFIPKSGVE